MWMSIHSMFLAILAMIAIPGYGDAGVITLQSPTIEHSDYNVEFNVADLVQNIETPHGAVEVHAFKSTENDEILREPGIPRYSQLIWVSLGSPTFVFQNGTESSSGHGLFRETVGGFYGYVQMLTSKHRALLAAKAKFRYNVSIDESQIVNLILSTFECSLYLHDQIGNEYQIKGSVNNFHRFPLKLNFGVLPNSPERKTFALALEQPTVDHVFMCKMATKSRKTLTNTLKITSRMSEQIGLESKLFGPVEKRSDQVFITRQQSAMLARELYSALVIREEYDMPQNKFEEAFVQGLISQAAAQSFRLQLIDTALASISRYGTHDVTADLKPDVIKRDLGSIMKVETRDEKSRIVLDETKISKEDDQFVVKGDLSADTSFIGLFDCSASMNFGYENSHSKDRNDETLIDQLHELNTASQNEVTWEIEGEKVVPKSINVSQLIRSKFSQTLEFSRVTATHEEAAFVRRMGLSTLHGEKSAIQTTFCERMESQFQQLNGTLQQLLNPKPDINECANNTCQNGASCLNQVNRYRCICAAGFTGVRCEININECTSNPCSNDARCLNLVNRYQCICAAGFAGVNCEMNINKCASSPCLYYGTCINGINQFTCICLRGFSGARCESVTRSVWEIHYGRNTYGDTFVHSNGLDDCLAKCRIASRCYSVDWDGNCWIQTDINIVWTSKSGCDKYVPI